VAVQGDYQRLGRLDGAFAGRRARRHRTCWPGQNLEEKVPPCRSTPAGLSVPGLQATSNGRATMPVNIPRRVMPVLRGGDLRRFTTVTSPSRHGRGHEVAEELLLVDDKTAGLEPRAHVEGSRDLRRAEGSWWDSHDQLLCRRVDDSAYSLCSSAEKSWLSNPETPQ